MNKKEEEKSLILGPFDPPKKNLGVGGNFEKEKKTTSHSRSLRPQNQKKKLVSKYGLTWESILIMKDEG